MRKVYDTNGNDVTTTAQTYLQQHRSLILADLFWFQFWIPVAGGAGQSGTPSNFFYTSASFPVQVAKLQAGPNNIQTVNATFQPTRIQRGRMSWEIGLQAQTCELTWYTTDSYQPFLSQLLPWGFKFAAAAGFFDEIPIWIYRAIFQATSDNKVGALVGTSLIWRGFLRDAEVTRDHVKLSVSSLLEIFQNTNVPTQLIQPGNRVPPYMPAGPPNILGGSLGATPLGSSTPTDIQFDTSGWNSAAKPSADHVWRDFYMCSVNIPPPAAFVTLSGEPAPFMYRIRDNVTIGTTLHLYLYEPVVPLSILTSRSYITIFNQLDINVGVGAAGFPYVPPPETGL